MNALKKENIEEPLPFKTVGKKDFHPANKNKRVIAFILDAIILGGGGALVVSLIRGVLGAEGLSALLVPLTIQMVIMPFVYWVGLTLYFRATPGKKMMGLFIIDSATGNEPSMGQLMMRELMGRPLSGFILGLGYFWCLTNKEGKTWHDLMGKTQVVEEK